MKMDGIILATRNWVGTDVLLISIVYLMLELYSGNIRISDVISSSWVLKGMNFAV